MKVATLALAAWCAGRPVLGQSVPHLETGVPHPKSYVFGGRPVRPTSCPSADSLLGPMTRATAKAHLSGEYLRFQDSTTLGLDIAVYERIALITAYYHGRGAPQEPTLILRSWMPGERLVEAEAKAASLVLVLEDSVSLDLGPPQLPVVIGPVNATSMPISALITMQELSQIAKASDLVLKLGAYSERIPRANQQAAEALYRALVCGIAVPEPNR